jgi:hypothetical protein
MSNDGPFDLLCDFVYWVRKRRPLHENPHDAWVSDETLEYVTQGIERFLEGKNEGKNPNPWPKQRGNKSKPATMWECYYLACVVENENAKFLPQHSAEGGAFQLVGKRLNLSAQAVESHVRKAQKLLDTSEGTREYHGWLTRYKDNGLLYYPLPQDHPAAIAFRERRKAAGLRNGRSKVGRKRRTDSISGEIDPK